MDIDRASARADIENLLYRYAQLCDEADAAGLGSLLGGAEIRFGNQPPIQGAEPIATFYAGVLGNASTTRHLISNVIIEPTGEHQAHAHARYARWLVRDEPELVGLGDYQSDFVCEGGKWRFATHQVVRTWFRETP